MTKEERRAKTERAKETLNLIRQGDYSTERQSYHIIPELVEVIWLLDDRLSKVKRLWGIGNE